MEITPLSAPCSPALAQHIAVEVPLPGLRVLGVLRSGATPSRARRGAQDLSGVGLYAAQWTPRSTREPAQLALRIVDDPGGQRRARIAAFVAKLQASPINGLALPIDYGVTNAGRTYYTTELFAYNLAQLSEDLYPAVPAILAEVARVLKSLHARGMAHGNLTPANVLLDRQAGSLRVALSDPAALGAVGEPSDARSEIGDIQAWGRIAAAVRAMTVAARPLTPTGGAELPAADPATDPAADIVDALIQRTLGASSDDRSQPPITAAEIVDALAQTLSAVPRSLTAEPGSGASGLPRTRLAVGSGPTRSESAHARRALERAGFEVIACLGQGASASVFQVRRGGGEHAIKLVHEQSGDAAWSHLETVLAVLRGLDSERLALPTSLGSLAGGEPFYTTALYPASVRSWSQRLEPVEIIEVMAEAAAALALLHRTGVVHRDVKPSNLLLQRAHDGASKRGRRPGRVVLADFECAVLLFDPSSGQPYDGAARPGGGSLVSRPRTSWGRLGTRAYRPPEAHAGGLSDSGTEVTPAWDVWSWAMTALSILSLRIHGDHAVLRDAAQNTPEPTALAALLPDIPVAVSKLLLRCLNPTPETRPNATDAVRVMRRAAIEMRTPQHISDHAPVDEPARIYRGLEAYTARERSDFTGRERDLANVIEQLDEHRVVVLLGPSGVGKTSFVQAALEPSLEQFGVRGSGSAEVIRVRPGARPFAALATALLARGNRRQPDGEAEGRPSASHIERLAADLRRRGPAAFCAQIAQLTAQSGRVPVLIIDQAEELFTSSTSAADRRAFGSFLRELINHEREDASPPVSGIHSLPSATALAGLGALSLIFAVRDDYYGPLLSLPVFAEGRPHAHYSLPALDPIAIRAALEAPAARYGYQWEREAIMVVVAQIAQVGANLSLLQLTADEMWARRDRSARTIPSTALATLGPSAGAIGRHAARVLDALGDDEAVWADLAFPVERRDEHLQRVVRSLLVPLADHAGRCQRPRQVGELLTGLGPDDQLRALAKRVLPRLVASGLLSCVRSLQSQRLALASTDTIALVHESLLSDWPRLAGWLDDERPRRRLADEIRAGAEGWEALGRIGAGLWGRDQFERAQLRRDELGLTLSGSEADFWAACEQALRRRRRLGVAALVALAVAAQAAVVQAVLAIAAG